MRWIAATLLVITALTTLLWVNSERLAQSIVGAQLAANELELLVLELLPPDARGAVIPHIKIRGTGFDFEAHLLRLQPLRANRYVLTIERASLVLLDSQEDSEPVIADLWQQLMETMPLLPDWGRIDELGICMASDCRQLSIAWHRYEGAVRVSASLPGEGAEAEILIADDVRLDWTLRGRQQTASGYWQIRQVTEQFKIEAFAAALPDLTLTDLRVPGLSGAIETVSVRLQGEVSGDATMSDLTTSWVANGEVTAHLDWVLQQADFVASSKGLYEVAFRLGDGDLITTLLAHPTIQLNDGESGQATVRQVVAGECQLNLRVLNLACGAEDVLIGATMGLTLNGRQTELAADVHMTNTRFEQNDETATAGARLSLEVFDLQAGVEVFSGTADVRSSAEAMTLTLLPGARLLDTALSLRAEQLTDSPRINFELMSEGRLTRLQAAATLLAVEGLDALDVVGRYRVESSGYFESPEVITHSTRLALSEVALEYDGYELNQAGLSLTLSGWPFIDGRLTFAAAEASVGVPIEAISGSALLQLNPDEGLARLTGEALNLRLLGGRLTSEQYDYDIGSGDGALLANLTELELAKILALQRQDFSVSGRLSGSVPVQIKAGNVSVKDGAVAALAPGGVIRYQPDRTVTGIAEQNRKLAIVLDAMSNFQYHTLEARVDYSPEGNMIARTRLQGANPDYQQGRDVHLNLTVEENIRTLLESLRLGAELVEKVSGRPGGG